MRVEAPRLWRALRRRACGVRCGEAVPEYTLPRDVCLCEAIEGDTAMHNYMHHVPGRLRVRIGALKGNPVAVRDLRRALQALAGVTEVEINPLTGSVLAHYDRRPETASAILGALRQQACWERPDSLRAVAATVQRTPAGVQPLGSKIAQKVAVHVFEAALEKAVIAAIAALL